MFKTIKSAGIIVVCCLILATTGTKGQVHEQYIGCFVDNINDQQWKPVLKNQSDLTIEICIRKCHNETNRIKSETTFAALANGRGCICRNNSGQELCDRNCNVKCSGAQVQNCGGNTKSRFYSLYSVCRIGYFGRKCDKLCHCKRHLPCDRKTGICPDGCKEQWTGTSCNISSIHKQYIGCYGDGRDHSSTWAMEVKNPGGKTGYNIQTTNSIEFCIEICSTSAYTYAGMQYGYDCFCGEKYARYGNKTNTTNKEAICNFSCPANPSQICGGDYANSVYYVCPVGFYGRNCTDQCNCSDDGPCRFDGSCLCKPGDTGSSCNVRVCPVGFYGRKCTDRCLCNGSPCRFNGSCLCKSGWTGSACNIRDCSINNGDCGSDEMCESVDLGFAQSSMCRCKDGSFRDNNTCRLTHLRYVGCYKGNTTQYMSVELPANDTLAIEFCILNCRQLNKKYSIIQGGIACLCGDDYGRNSPDDECRVSCAGNTLQYCGGKNTVDGTPIYVVYTAWITNGFLEQYVGCYNDTSTYAMEMKFSWGGAGNNTIESCTRHCTSLNYTYAGLQYGYNCFCGNSYDIYGSLPESRCNMSCSGNSSQICGGEFANSVYAVNYRSYRCLIDRDCERHETCNVINLNYMNVSRCRCQQGFHRMSTWGNCTDVDECKSGTSCSALSENCVNYAGSFRCECKNGFTDVSGNCEDVDECRNDPSVCDEATERCTNTNGSYLCQCKHGYENTTFDNCTDVNECTSGVSTCDATSENCVNNIGSYICECKDGFVNISGKCEDIDECINGTVVCDAETELCKNTIGSYICHCKPGYENMTNGNCTHCTDVDECKSNTSSCNPTSENCVNNIGSYICECKDGFKNESGQCEDVDECNSSDTKCYPTIEHCVNTFGSFRCGCKEGFSANNSRYCEDIDECQTNNTCNKASEDCTNNIGSYICKCKKGFVDISGQSEAQPNTTPNCQSGAQTNDVVVVSLVCLLVVVILAGSVSVWLFRKNIFVRYENSGSSAGGGNSKDKGRKASGHSIEMLVPLGLRNPTNTKIPVGDLPALFKTKKSQPGTLEEEFQSIPEEDSKKTCLEGKRKELKHRNRFLNIIPYDHNRVTLLRHHKQFSDYINASFIKSYNSHEKLIATQGPNPDTLTHFWQMNFENNVGTIVMITNLMENAKKKCARYWPEYDGSMTFDDMTITLKLTESWPNYVIRHLQLVKGAKTMDIKQWHFTVWPDHGVPSDVKGFLNFRRNVLQSMSLDKYTVVHCSAGVGRTGTFIAINYLLEQAEAERMVDVVECVRSLRQQRMQMVQTLDQYEFIYAALATEFTIGKTTISARDFDSTFRRMLGPDKLSAKTQLEIQFQVLQEQWAKQSESENPFHVFAKSLDTCELSEVVQAVFVQSWKTKDAYIVPEYPDKKAVFNYFWTICLDYECKLIIYLDNGQNSSLFFPKQPGESLCVDSWRLHCKSSESDRHGTQLKIALTQFSESEYANTAVSKASGEVTVLNVAAYVNDNRLNYDAIYATYNVIKTLESKNGANKSAPAVIIVSRPNCQLSGLFLAAINAFDMLDEAKEVDLYQIVYDIKKSRSRFIPTFATYEELHNIVNHRIGYTSPADIYSNV